MAFIKQYSPSFCVTHRCNLNCVYCYQNHNQDRMSKETAIDVMNKIFKSAPEECTSIHVGFIGGEPLLEFELIKYICEYTWIRNNSKSYIFFATTNGTVLTENMKKWFRENQKRFKLTLSLDGAKDSHDYNRSGSFDKIDFNFFQEVYKDQGVKMTISEYSINKLAENIKYIHSLGFEIHGSNLAEGNFDWESENFLYIMAKQLKEIVRFYVGNPEIKVCQMLDKNLARCEQKNIDNFKYCGIGYGANFFDVDGNEYPCPYCTPMTFSMDEIKKISMVDFKNPENFSDKDCLENCYLYPICTSCSGNNYKQTGCFTKHERSKCNITKLVTLFISKMMAEKIINKTDNLDENSRYWTIEAIKKINELYYEKFEKYIK